MADNAFGDLDDAFAGAEAKAASVGELHPPGTYGFVITPFDAKENGQMVEFDTFKAGDTTGIRMMLEFLDPAVVKDEKTGEDVKMIGKTVEKVFWVSAKTIPYLKHDFGVIQQCEIPEGEKLSKTMERGWAGRTFQGVLNNTPDKKGIVRNDISFLTQWSPPEKEAAKDEKKADDKKEAATAGGKKQTKF